MLCISARWDSAHSALGTYQRHLFQQHGCLRLSLLERGACSQQSALRVEMCATARSHSEKSAESSGAGRENTVVTAAGRAQAARPTALATGRPETPKRGTAEMETTQKLSTRTVRAPGGEMEETKLALGRCMLLWLRKGSLGGRPSMWMKEQSRKRPGGG